MKASHGETKMATKQHISFYAVIADSLCEIPHGETKIATKQRVFFTAV